MKHLNELVNEALLAKPFVEDDKVKVLALVAKENVDDNLELMKGMNRVCLIWSPEDGNGYMCANGGKEWNDGLQWTSLVSLLRVIGKQNWKEVDKAYLTYSYYSTIGEPKKYEITAYSVELSKSTMDKLYKQNGKTLWIKNRGYSTAALKQIITKWKNDGYLGSK